MLQAFLEAGADPNETIGVFAPVPPLMYAFHLRRLDIFQILFQAGANIFLPYKGETIIEAMARETYEHFSRVRNFSEDGAEGLPPEQWEMRWEEFSDSRAILRWCIQVTDIEKLSLLQANSTGRYSLLTWLILIEDRDLFTYLIQRGFPVDFQAPPDADPQQEKYFQSQHYTAVAQVKVASFLRIPFPVYSSLTENWNTRTFQYFKALLTRDRLCDCLPKPLPNEIWMEILRRLF
jgi:hypothetical protein